MATLREIRQRVSGVKNTQKITKAMKMVAAAKLRRAQDAVIAARPYARKMKELLSHLNSVADISAHPLFSTRPIQSVAVIAVTADRGLCGAFNSNVIRMASAHIQHAEMNTGLKVKLFCVGRKGADFFQKNNYTIAGKQIGIFSGLKFSHAQSVIDQAVSGFLSGEFDRVEVIYNEFKSIIQQRTVIEQILPIQSLPVKSEIADSKKQINYIYEPASEAIITSIVPKHLNFQLWHALLESNASEQGARMTAMDNATTNASDLIRSLQLSYNKARQASITKELLEIVSGAEALRNA